MKRLAFIFGLLIIIIIILADTRHLGFLERLYDFPSGDKVGHFLVFGLFSLTVNLRTLETKFGSTIHNPSKQEYRRVAINTSLIISAFAGLEEFSQIWFPSRTASLFDLAASCLGIASFAWLALRIKTRFRRLYILSVLFMDKLS